MLAITCFVVSSSLSTTQLKSFVKNSYKWFQENQERASHLVQRVCNVGTDQWHVSGFCTSGLKQKFFHILAQNKVYHFAASQRCVTRTMTKFYTVLCPMIYLAWRSCRTLPSGFVRSSRGLITPGMCVSLMSFDLRIQSCIAKKQIWICLVCSVGFCDATISIVGLLSLYIGVGLVCFWIQVCIAPIWYILLSLQRLLLQ